MLSSVCQSDVAPAVEKFCRAVAQPYQRVQNGHQIPAMMESRSAPIDDFAPERRGCAQRVGEHATRRRRTRLPTGRLEAVVLANGCSCGTSALIGRRQGFSCSGSGRFISELHIVSRGRHNSSRRCFLPFCLLRSARVASDTDSLSSSFSGDYDTLERLRLHSLSLQFAIRSLLPCPAISTVAPIQVRWGNFGVGIRGG